MRVTQMSVSVQRKVGLPGFGNATFSASATVDLAEGETIASTTPIVFSELAAQIAVQCIVLDAEQRQAIAEAYDAAMGGQS